MSAKRPPGSVGDPEADIWDVAVVGTGAGGATAGFNLARHGHSVLFLERGRLLDEDQSVRRGVSFRWNGNAEDALAHGWWPRPVFFRDTGVEVATQPLAGCGTGGSTSLFSMLMDRFRPEDFVPAATTSTTRDAVVPDEWPITYDDLLPYYEQAERLYRVRGTPDPLSSSPQGSLLEPPDPSVKERVLLEELRRAGLHPYRMHYACEQVPGCAGCYAKLCPHACRNDARRMCLNPALEQHGAQILAECRVVRFEAEGAAVRRAVCDWQGRRIAIRARAFVLAANALFSPAILQRSANDRFPEGLGNRSGLVGRHLMLHVSDLCALRFRRPMDGIDGVMHHGISVSDFSVRDQVRLGTVHAHSFAPAVEASRGFHTHATSTAFVTILEDLPYAENRVIAKTGSDEDIVLEYHYPSELFQRSRALLQHLKTAAQAQFEVQLLQPMGRPNMTHICGTCRFGTDPSTSVLDPENRVHDIDNLYVVDASFFPTSGGTSPSLTIAANSLRVSDIIHRRI